MLGKVPSSPRPQSFAGRRVYFFNEERQPCAAIGLKLRPQFFDIGPDAARFEVLPLLTKRRDRDGSYRSRTEDCAKTSVAPPLAGWSGLPFEFDRRPSTVVAMSGMHRYGAAWPSRNKKLPRYRPFRAFRERNEMRFRPRQLFSPKPASAMDAPSISKSSGATIRRPSTRPLQPGIRAQAIPETPACRSIHGRCAQ